MPRLDPQETSTICKPMTQTTNSGMHQDTRRATRMKPGAASMTRALTPMIRDTITADADPGARLTREYLNDIMTESV
jgi:hypothetical protein